MTALLASPEHCLCSAAAFGIQSLSRPEDTGMRATVGTILATGLLLLAGCSSSSSGNNQNQNPGVTATWTGTVSSPGTT